MSRLDRMPPAIAFPKELRDAGQFFSKELRGDVEHSLEFLPDDLIEKVFSLLPLRAKLVCRCVCRSWNSILSKDAFLAYTSNSSAGANGSGAPRAYFILTTRGPFAFALDPIINLWHMFNKPGCPGASVLAASHSLLCVGNQVSECRSLIIYNLLTKAWRLLPNTLRVGLLHKVTMAVNPMSHSYIVVVTGEDTSDFRGRHTYRLHTEVYDSMSTDWRMAGDALPEAKFGSEPGVWYNGIFYCVTEMPYGITAFDLAKGRWMEPSVNMPIGLSHPSLVSCQGQLMMVGIQEGDSVHTLHHFGVESVPSSLPEAPADRLSRMPWQVSRSSSWPRTPQMSRPSLAWSGPLHAWASTQLRALLCSWPSVTLPFPLLSPTAMASPSGIPFSSPAMSLPNSPSRLIKGVKIWTWKSGKEWRLVDEMPEQLSSEFLAHLTPKTPLICAGVSNDICISSYQSPRAVIFEPSNSGWRFAASDPLFPKDRDTHLLGFAVTNDACEP